MHTKSLKLLQMSQKCPKSHKRNSFSFWVLTEDFLLCSDYSWRREELLWCRKTKKRPKVDYTKSFATAQKTRRMVCAKKRENVSLFFKTTFQVRKSVWTFEFHFCNCLLRFLDQWKTAKENIFWISWISTESSRKSLMRSNCRCRWHDVTVGRPRRYKSRLKWTWVWPPQPPPQVVVSCQC